VRASRQLIMQPPSTGAMPDNALQLENDASPAVNWRDALTIVIVRLQSRTSSNGSWPRSGSDHRGGEASLYRIVIVIAVAVAALYGSANAQNQGPDPASNALGQLRNATGGSQGTGQTFDGGHTPTDATPSGGATVPDVQPSSTTARSPSRN
jgi:hypothetical protein